MSSNYRSGISAVLIAIGVLAFVMCLFGIKPPPKKPIVIKLPDAEKVGEHAGKTTTKFSRGFLRGTWGTILGGKEKSE